MTDPAAPFIRAICEHPFDDGPRLRYADWLEENGGEAGSRRAEFVRVQIARSWMEEAGTSEIPPGEGHTCSEDPCPVCAAIEQYEELRSQERELWVAAPQRKWFPLPREFSPCICDPTGTSVAAGQARRGFVESITCKTADFVDHAAAIFAAQPVVEVRLSDRRLIQVLPTQSGRPVLQKLGSVCETTQEGISKHCVAWGREQAGLPPLEFTRKSPPAPPAPAIPSTRPGGPASASTGN